MHEGWAADYETAERRVHETGRELLILYQESRPGARYPVEEALKEEALSKRIDGYVRCKLIKSYEPDRRYVAQFGVDRAPALILVHGDGTYHARAGTMSAADITAFLNEARPPGNRPVVNPYILRRARYDWHRTMEAAEEAASRSRKPILIVYHQSLTSDWRTLRKLLGRQEVYRRFADMVHCRIGVLTFSAVNQVPRFGTLKLPAIVIARGDGTYDVLELPTSYEAIVRFADNARRRADASGADATASAEP
jgi:hypothetical protein